MTKIINERIIGSSMAPLGEGDMQTLLVKKNTLSKQLLFIYLPLALILLFVFLNGLDVIGREKGFRTIEIDDDKAERFREVAPWFCGFLFLLLNGYFLSMYLKTLAPVMKDIKRKQKKLLRFKVDKNDMSAFDKYYITTPIRKSQLLRIQREDFYALNDAEDLTLEIGPESCVVLGISQQGKKLRTIDQL